MTLAGWLRQSEQKPKDQKREKCKRSTMEERKMGNKARRKRRRKKSFE